MGSSIEKHLIRWKVQSKLCLLTVFVMLVAACREPDGREFMAPEIVSAEAVIDGATAVFRCTLSNGRAESCGFILDDGNVKHELEGVLQDNVFTATASGLEVDKTYRWEAFVTAGISVIRSQEQSFTAPDGFIPIPDAAFKAYLLKLYDLNGDGELSPKEGERVYEIHLTTSQLGVKSLKGIEYMENLEELDSFLSRTPVFMPGRDVAAAIASGRRLRADGCRSRTCLPAAWPSISA